MAARSFCRIAAVELLRKGAVLRQMGQGVDQEIGQRRVAGPCEYNARSLFSSLAKSNRAGERPTWARSNAAIISSIEKNS